MNQSKIYPKMNSEAVFKDIDRYLLEGFECSQFSYDNKKFLSMIKEQTIAAINNKKYLSIKS